MTRWPGAVVNFLLGKVNETQMPFLTMLKTGEVRGRQTEGLPTEGPSKMVFAQGLNLKKAHRANFSKEFAGIR